MPTLKTTLKVESTNLFPTPVSFTMVNNNAVNGNYSGFNEVQVGATALQLNLVGIDATGAFLYVESKTTNTGDLLISTQGTNGAPNSFTSIVTAGPYASNDTVVSVAPVDVTGGSGTGIGLFAAVDSLGEVIGVFPDPANPGIGYIVGDTLTIGQTGAFGGGGAADPTVDVDTLLGNVSAAIQLKPGDVGFVPVGNETDMTLTVTASTGTQSLKYFIGLR